MPTNETLKTFKNSQANVQIRQEELLSESQNLSQVYANDVAAQTADTLKGDETFSTRGILSNLKDILRAKISGESNFLKESEIDALEVKTPAEIKKQKIKRKERKARKKAYKAELKLIEQLEGQENITTADVKAVEKRLLALEGYENNSELNSLTDVKYQYLAEKTGEVEAVDKTYTLTKYYMKHSSLKSVYQNFDAKQLDEEYKQKLYVYQKNTDLIEEYSYRLPNEENEYETTYNNYEYTYKLVKEKDEYVDNRKWSLMAYKKLDTIVNNLQKNFSETMKKKKERLHILQNYAKNVLSVEFEGDNPDFSEEDDGKIILKRMAEDFGEYVKAIIKRLKDSIIKDRENQELNSVYERLRVYDITTQDLMEKVKNFDGLFDLIEDFDNSFIKKYTDMDKKYHFIDQEYDSMFNYIRRLNKVEAKELADKKVMLESIRNNYIKEGWIDDEAVREQMKAVTFDPKLVFKTDDKFKDYKELIAGDNKKAKKEAVDTKENKEPKVENVDIKENKEAKVENVDIKENKEAKVENVDIKENKEAKVENVDIKENKEPKVEKVDVKENKEPIKLAKTGTNKKKIRKRKKDI